VKLKIKLGAIWSMIAPIIVPIIVSVASRAILKQGEKIVTKPKR
jgi:hypothetical protein